MRSGSLLVPVLLLVLGGCESKRDQPAVEGKPAGEKGYAADVARICDVMTLSGAGAAPEGEQMFTVADWLGRNLETDAGHDFLVAFQQTPDSGKAAMLNAESSKLGLGSCALASSWTGP